MWILVYIIIGASLEPKAEKIAVYRTIQECFYARESLAATVGGQEGYFPTGQQGICINTYEPRRTPIK